MKESLIGLGIGLVIEEIEKNKKAYVENEPLHREEVEALIAAEK